MATSSITANFFTDDPKAANAIVHALFTNVKPSPRLPTMVGRTKRYTPAGERAFFKRLAAKAHSMKAGV